MAINSAQSVLLGVGGYEMYRARRFKERPTDIEYLHRATFEL